MTKILYCTCEHQFQDAVYGKGRRVCNAMKPNGSATKHKCTVCGAVKSN